MRVPLFMYKKKCICNKLVVIIFSTNIFSHEHPGGEMAKHSPAVLQSKFPKRIKNSERYYLGQHKFTDFFDVGSKKRYNQINYLNM